MANSETRPTLVAIGSDHAGYELKEQIKTYLQDKKLELKDFGANSKDSVHYPDFAKDLTSFLKENNDARGILICGTGIGMSIAANRHKGIRAALCHNVDYAKLSREHNDANVLVLGARFTELADAKEIVEAWLATDFAGGRHQTRLDMLDSF